MDKILEKTYLTIIKVADGIIAELREEKKGILKRLDKYKSNQCHCKENFCQYPYRKKHREDEELREQERRNEIERQANRERKQKYRWAKK